jgi:GTPase SAR1 family protein
MRNYYFSNYNDQKWDWTRNAATKFISGFKRFDGYIEEKEQVYIGVYGPTQVGKTTFILSLLGIDFDQLNPLSDALRGGQAKGKSATVTCTIFKKTDEDQFRIIWPSGQAFTCLTLIEVEQVMQNLRNQIYLTEDFPLSPLLVEIPMYYFNQVDMDQRTRDLSIIDLPGDDSKDEMEMLHVNRVLKEYISRCKVCIIMEISSQMTGLTKLDKEFVKDWAVLPEQFRILFTRSVTNGSVRKAIEDNLVNTVEEFRSLYTNEMASLLDMNDLATAIYPLEFGDSWVDLKDSQPTLFEKTKPWLEIIFASLVDDLTQIHSPEQEIKKLKSMDRYLLKQRKQELDKFNLDKETIRLQREDLQLFITNLRCHSLKERKRLRRYKELEGNLSIMNSINEPDFFLPSWSNLNFGQKKVSYLNRQFNGELTDLEQSMRQLTEEFNEHISKWNRNENIQLPKMIFPEHHFDVSLNLVNYYILDQYFSETTFIEDIGIAKRKLSKAFKQFEADYQMGYQEAFTAINRYIQSQKAACENYEAEIKDQKNILEVIEKDFESIEKKIREVEIEWQHDLERSKQLDLFLMEGFIEQSNQYKENLLSNQASKTEKWMIQQFWNVLKLQAERIIDHVN